MRRYGEPIDPRQTYRERPGAYAVVREGRDILITEQIDPHEYQLPGGGIDPGESPVRAVMRECLEETGWLVRVVRRLGAFQRFAYLPEYGFWARKICHVYLARPVLRRGDPTESGHRAIWMSVPTALDLLTIEGDRALLRRTGRGP